MVSSEARDRCPTAVPARYIGRTPIAGLALAALTLAACNATATPHGGEAANSVVAGTVHVCSSCHGPEAAAASHRPFRGWPASRRITSWRSSGLSRSHPRRSARQDLHVGHGRAAERSDHRGDRGLLRGPDPGCRRARRFAGDHRWQKDIHRGHTVGKRARLHGLPRRESAGQRPDSAAGRTASGLSRPAIGGVRVKCAG